MALYHTIIEALDPLIEAFDQFSIQWNDILEIIRRQGASLDLVYLQQWADALGVRDLLENALLDASNTHL